MQETADKERSRALRQQAKDFATMLKNLDRQKVGVCEFSREARDRHIHGEVYIATLCFSLQYILTSHAHKIKSTKYTHTHTQDIALVLSGERAPQRELVKMAAARCGLSVPEVPELEGLTLEGVCVSHMCVEVHVYYLYFCHTSIFLRHSLIHTHIFFSTYTRWSQEGLHVLAEQCTFVAA